MNLTWHIIRKDIRRLWLPLALWLLLLLAHTALLGVSVGHNATPSSYEGLRYFANTWGVIVCAVGFILAAWLVMEDSLMDTSAFWLTRPISGARLLVAKLGGAFLMFSGIPVLMLMPLWLASGFSLRECAWAAVECALGQGILTLLAFALAGITATSGQFLVRAIGATVVLPVFLGYALGFFGPENNFVGGGLAESRYWLVLVLLALSLVVLFMHQFLTRRTRRSATLFGLMLLLVAGVRFAWKWDFLSSFHRAGNDPVTQGVKFEVGQFSPAPAQSLTNGWPLRLEGITTGEPLGTYVEVDSVRSEWVKADVRFKAASFRPSAWFHSAAAIRQVVGLPARDEPPTSWVLDAVERREVADHARVTGMKLVSEINAILMRGRVLGEIPLRKGAELQVGSSLTRIVGLEWVDGKFYVRLQERDAWLTKVPGAYSAGVGGSRRTWPAEDGFVLLNRSTGFEQVPVVIEIGTVVANSIMTGQRELVVLPPTRDVNGQAQEIPGWADGIVLVKVRFLPDHQFSRPLEGEPFILKP